MDIPVDLLDGGKLTIVCGVIFWGLVKGWIAVKPQVQALLDVIKYMRERETIRDAEVAALTEAVKQIADVMDSFRRAAEEKKP